MENKAGLKKWIWLIFAVVFYIIVARLNPPEGLSPEGWKAIILMVCAVIIWVSECIPIGIASCLLLFLPALLHIQETKVVLQNFGISTMFFMLASGIIAKAFIDVGLGYRISLYITSIFGKKSKMVLLSFMACTALISSVLADIPTAIILSSIASTLLEKNGCKPGQSNFGKSMMMGIPIAACLGGFATPVGSGINVLCINLLKNITGIDVSFMQWTAIGLPMAVVMTLVAWAVLITVFKPEVNEVAGLENVVEDRKKLGSLSGDEKKFTIIFCVTLILWITQSLTRLDLTLVSLLCVTTFFLPKIDLMDWNRAQSSTGWSGILLVGAANALAMILSQQGSAEWISNVFLSQFADSSLLILMLVITIFGLFIHFLVPVGSAVLSVCVPIVAVLAEKAGVNPMYLILILGYTAKCIFLLPLDPIPLTTYSYGYWKLGEMPKAGVIIAILWTPIMVAFMYAAIALNIV